MEIALDERILALERTLGVDERTEAKTSDLDVHNIRKILEKKGVSKVLTVPIEKLKKLKDITVKSESRPLGERLTIIEGCEQITRQRAELLEHFEEKLKVILDCDKLTGIASQEEQLEQVEKDIRELYITWLRQREEMSEFGNRFHSVVAMIKHRISEAEQQGSVQS